MRKDPVFCGNEICCAAYAFVNTVQDASIDYRLFELTSSVPFGVKHQREPDFSRLLTTFCDLNIGVERGAQLWGYRQKKENFTEGREAACYIAEESRERGCLVGPVDMGRLGYLMLPALYTNMDHYLAVHQRDGQIFLMDSEGILTRQITKEEMCHWFDAGNLPEARGCLSVRSFEKKEKMTGRLREEAAIKGSVRWIQNNMQKAKGGQAVIQCCEWLTEQSPARWKLSFLYDLSYLMQRKILQADWFLHAERFSVCKEKESSVNRELVQEQICLLQWIFRLLQKENSVDIERFYRLAELEERLTGYFHIV